MTLNKLTALSMLVAGSAYVDARMGKRAPTHFTDVKKKRKRKAERAARRKNRK